MVKNIENIDTSLFPLTIETKINYKTLPQCFKARLCELTDSITLCTLSQTDKLTKRLARKRNIRNGLSLTAYFKKSRKSKKLDVVNRLSLTALIIYYDKIAHIIPLYSRLVIVGSIEVKALNYLLGPNVTSLYFTAHIFYSEYDENTKQNFKEIEAKLFKMPEIQQLTIDCIQNQVAWYQRIFKRIIKRQENGEPVSVKLGGP